MGVPRLTPDRESRSRADPAERNQRLLRCAYGSRGTSNYFLNIYARMRFSFFFAVMVVDDGADGLE
jgi:hypothetical protein